MLRGARACAIFRINSGPEIKKKVRPFFAGRCAALGVLIHKNATEYARDLANFMAKKGGLAPLNPKLRWNFQGSKLPILRTDQQKTAKPFFWFPDHCLSGKLRKRARPGAISHLPPLCSGLLIIFIETPRCKLIHTRSRKNLARHTHVQF